MTGAINVALLLGLLAAATSGQTTAFQTTAASYETRLAEWRRQRAIEAAGPEGWTTVVALHWLGPGRTGVGSGPHVDMRLPSSAPPLVGIFHVSGAEVRFEAATGVEVKSIYPATGQGVVPDRTQLLHGTYTLTVIKRAGRLGVRVRDSASPARRRFKGIEAFPISPSHRLKARFVPFETARTVTVVNVIGDPVEFVSPGQIVFSLGGGEHRLDALFETAERKDLWVIFRDRTSGATTYAAGRYLHVPLPVAGIVDLDFNYAYNPPCAFTEFATCPIPPRQNWLKVAIEAGEKTYH